MAQSEKPMLWKVTGQVEMIQPVPGGIAQQGKKITVQVLANGSTFTVFVPDNEYNLENVQSVIAAAYANVAAVNGLSG